MASCNQDGQLTPISNYGSTIGSRGLMAPGINITSAYSGGGYIKMSGTSFAAPFVTATLGLLWSMFPMASAGDLVRSIRIGSFSMRHHRSIIPSLLDAEAAYHVLKDITKR